VEESVAISVFRQFAVDSASEALADLRAYLYKKFGDIYSLDWRHFEEVVCDIFRAHGFYAILTQPAKDGGADILLFSHSATGLHAIVECKKYQNERKVGVELVRTLVGAAVHWNVRQAYLVTTSDFTSVAKMQANFYAQRGYQIDLHTADDLFRLLHIYNDALPPIWSLTEDFRKELARINLDVSKRLSL
jgi:hypothetical protein